MTLAERTIQALSGAGIMLTTAESCTAGLISAAITDVAGSSKVFDRGFVTYSNESKTELLGVSSDLIKAHGAVSEEVVEAMATGALLRSRAMICIAVTGIAGPGGGADKKPEGRVCFGLATLEGFVVDTVDFGPLGRENVRQKTVEGALARVLHFVESF